MDEYLAGKIQESFLIKDARAWKNYPTDYKPSVEFAKKNKIEDGLKSKLLIVFDEFLNNIISYAYADDLKHEISVKLELSGNRLVINLEDDGIPFNPFAKDSLEALKTPSGQRTPGGLGIHFVKSIMDEYTYHRGIDTNVVTLIKILE